LAWSKADRERRRHKNESRDQRTEFERDRDRVLYASAFQRLAGITQIVRAGEADVFHTRQQHSIKVAQVGRRLAQLLLKKHPVAARRHGLDPEVVEAACLAHDLGHPPFGHIGEKTLDALVRKGGDQDGFEGNAQSFRILTKLAVRFADQRGIDLTRATLAATLKYPWFRENKGSKRKKWSSYRSEAKDFEFARQFHAAVGSENKTLEAELMDWSDDVAYSVHDLEDFHRCNAIPWRKIFDDPELILTHAAQGAAGKPSVVYARLKRAYVRLEKHLKGNYGSLLTEPYEGSSEQREQLRRMTSQLIGRYILAIKLIPAKFGDRMVEFNQDDVDEVTILKQITRDYIIGSPALIAQQHGQKRIITDLFNEISEALTSDTEYPAFLPVRLRYLRPIAGVNNARFVADCIAGLSEREALGLHGRLFGTATGSVLDPIVR
jgi:dGTPase